MKKKNLLIALTVLALISGTLIASIPNVAADTTSSILSIVKNIQTIVQSIQTTVQNTNTNLNKVKVETVITTPTMNTSTLSGAFNFAANEPWDLVAVYVTTSGVGTVQFGNQTVTTALIFGLYKIGDRWSVGSTPMKIADGNDVTDYPIFAGDILNVTDTYIAVPANTPFHFSWASIVYPPPEGVQLTYKILIQRPIDPNFSYNITYS